MVTLLIDMDDFGGIAMVERKLRTLATQRALDNDTVRRLSHYNPDINIPAKR